jgi:hypothetical protein
MRGTGLRLSRLPAHSGQSSQLLFGTHDRNAQLLSTPDFGVNVSHTDKGSLENDKIWIPLNMAA